MAKQTEQKTKTAAHRNFYGFAIPAAYAQRLLASTPKIRKRNCKLPWSF